MNETRGCDPKLLVAGILRIYRKFIQAAMLDEPKNGWFREVGRGPPWGGFLRRYWLPIAAVSEFEESPVKPVRLLGEDLTLYRDLGGVFGLIDRRCPHRRADLSYGFVEPEGLRC